MKENALPKKTLLLWQVRFAIIGIIITAACAFLCFASPWFLLLVFSLIALFAAAMFWYLPKYFKSCEIIFPKGAIIINRGVFIKTSHIMPYSRLVYAQSFSTPLAKYLGLAAMSLKAARSSLIIPEIDETEVNEFISLLTKEENA